MKIPIPPGADFVNIPDPIPTFEFVNEPPVNLPPIVNAGNDVVITLPTSEVILTGTASDTDSPSMTYKWTKVSGGAGAISSPDSLQTKITGLTTGIYIFKLTATDSSGASKSDDTTVTVKAAVVIPPVPGAIIAEGFGANAKGGEGKTVVYVTNTNSSGAGSFANAIGSNRIILFMVSGVIKGRFDLIGISYLTIDGNGKDIVIDNANNWDGISFDGANTHHCILKGITVTNAGNDGINVLDGAHDILITNCSSYGNRDGQIDIAGGNNVTVQYCLMGSSINNGPGPMLITGTNVSAHHNLYSPAGSGPGERCPLVHANYSKASADIRNNLIWKYGRSGGTGSGYGSAICYNAIGNIINNYYYTDGSSKESATNTDDGYGSGATGQAYISGNFSGNGVNANAPSTRALWPCPAVVTQSACEAAKIVLSQAGPRPLNAANAKLVNSVSLTGCN